MEPETVFLKRFQGMCLCCWSPGHSTVFRCLITVLSDLGPHFLPMFILPLNLKIILLDGEDLRKKKRERMRGEVEMLSSDCYVFKLCHMTQDVTLSFPCFCF